MHQITTFSRIIRRFAFMLVMALGLAACATTSTAKKISTTPLTPDEARVYEHGVDFIATLGGLEGKWREDWDKDLNVRIGSSDAIAIVTVKTLRTDTDPEHRVTHRLFASVDRVILGDTRGKEIEFAVREGAPGFMSVNDNQARVQGQSFVAFLKWYQDERGRIATHWHLSPASPEIVTETENTAGLRKGDGAAKSRVIVHSN